MRGNSAARRGTTRWRCCPARSTAIRRRVESVGAQPNRYRHRSPRRTARRRGAGPGRRRRRGARARRARRTVGQLAGPRRAVAGLAGLPAGRRRRRDGLGAAGAATRLPTSTTGWPSTRPAAAGCRRWSHDGRAADRRRPGGQRAGRLRGVPGASARRRRARGTCCPRGRWSARRKPRREVQAYRSPLGQRLVVRGRIGELLRYTQTLTLWHGVDRVDCRTTIDEFTGADRLLRLRWPCPVPGAMPVSEVGDAVVGRGFALLHNRSRTIGRHRGPSVDAGQPRLRLVRAVLGGPGPRRRRCPCDVGGRGGRPDRADVRPLARDLMVALVAGRRHRHLQQRRQAALRPPRRRLQPARRPDRARRTGPERLHRSRAGRRRSRLHRRARAAARRHRPGQGLGARGRAVGGRVGARRRPARFASAAGAGDRQPRRRRPRAGDRVGGRRPRRRRDRRRAAGPVGPAAVRAAHRRAAATAGCPASPSRPTARCTPR